MSPSVLLVQFRLRSVNPVFVKTVTGHVHRLAQQRPASMTRHVTMRKHVSTVYAWTVVGPATKGHVTTPHSPVQKVKFGRWVMDATAVFVKTLHGAVPNIIVIVGPAKMANYDKRSMAAIPALVKMENGTVVRTAAMNLHVSMEHRPSRKTDVIYASVRAVNGLARP